MGLVALQNISASTGPVASMLVLLALSLDSLCCMISPLQTSLHLCAQPEQWLISGKRRMAVSLAEPPAWKPQQGWRVLSFTLLLSPGGLAGRGSVWRDLPPSPSGTARMSGAAG